MRGEYFTAAAALRIASELPPRARRIRGFGLPNGRPHGTTSACAENTGVALIIDYQSGNYLRVRGEYTHQAGFPMSEGELPPRARRILKARSTLFWLAGTTSACAENTLPPNIKGEVEGNYLRVRGEYVSVAG